MIKKEGKTTKITVRGVPEELHQAIRLKAWAEKTTMNDIVLEAIYKYFDLKRSVEK